MNFRSLTWQQVALIAIAVAGVLAAYKFLGVNAAAVASVISHFVLASSGEPPSDPPAPNAPAPLTPPSAPKEPPASPFARAFLAAAVASMIVIGCGAAPWLKDVTQIEACQMQGRAVKAGDAGADAAWQAYDDCMRVNGYRDAGVQ